MPSLCRRVYFPEKTTNSTRESLSVLNSKLINVAVQKYMSKFPFLII